MMESRTSRRSFMQQSAGLAALAAGVGGVSARAFADRSKELNILCWEGYNSAQVLDPFRESSGATVKAESLMGVATQKAELHGPPAYYTPDWEGAKASVERLAELEPAVLAAGHGPPVAGAQTAAMVRELAENFDAIARPSHGRYAKDPAA